MLFHDNSRRRSSLLSATPLCLLCLLVCLAPGARAQEQQQRQRAPEQTDDVVRITTELVQTDVMVFDKQGRFVDGLRPEDFELQINGKPQAVSFFERIAAGSQSEAAQLAAARSGAGYVATSSPDEAVDIEAQERGRLIIFFVDDLHLSGASLILAREALQRFVDKQMNANDQVAIVSTSGQIGFLQQLTDNPTVLRAAIKRLNYKQNPEAYTGNTQISEYMASQVLDNGNRELYAYLLESIKIEQQMGPGNRQGDHRLAASYSAAPYLRNRLRQINSQGRMVTADTLSALRSLMLSSATLPGRKLVFFLSDGFLINERKSGALEVLHKVTEDAARAGAVVYTMDLRGAFLGLGSGVDASTNDYIDLTARRVGVASGEINATREPLKLIADATGGRAIFNSNSIDDGILQAIRETSSYYLLAWRPDSAEQRDTRARLKVVLKEHPELRVRLRTNTFSAPVPETQQPATIKEPDKATGESGGTKATDGKTNATGGKTKESGEKTKDVSTGV
ncbi:MAG TPA: VWA domain-containing protein, partial [Pyrinomonadaceae bacterium]